MFFLFQDALVAIQEVDKGWFQTRIERTFAYALPLNTSEVMDLDQVHIALHPLLPFCLLFLFSLLFSTMLKSDLSRSVSFPQDMFRIAVGGLGNVDVSIYTFAVNSGKAEWVADLKKASGAK
jgi:hypothetical protein